MDNEKKKKKSQNDDSNDHGFDVVVVVVILAMPWITLFGKIFIMILLLIMSSARPVASQPRHKIAAVAFGGRVFWPDCHFHW